MEQAPIRATYPTLLFSASAALSHTSPPLPRCIVVAHVTIVVHINIAVHINISTSSDGAQSRKNEQEQRLLLFLLFVLMRCAISALSGLSMRRTWYTRLVGECALSGRSAPPTSLSTPYRST